MTASSSARTTRRIALRDLKRAGARTAFSEPVLTGANLGNKTLTITIPVGLFARMSDVANEARLIETGGNRASWAQRALNEFHAKGIARYIIRGLLKSLRDRWEAQDREIPEELDELLGELGVGPYQGLQPLTCNIRECEPGGGDLELELRDGQMILHLRQSQVLWVIDGQHRRYAFDMIMRWLSEIVVLGRYFSRKRHGIMPVFVPEGQDDLELTPGEIAVWNGVQEEATSFCTIDATVHLGLVVDQERQLFHDLNNLVKKPDNATNQAFDLANPVSRFIRNILEPNNILDPVQILDVGSKKGGKGAIRKEAVLFRDDVASISALLFSNATAPSAVSPRDADKDVGLHFWKLIASQSNWGVEDWNRKTLLAQPTMLKALAGLFYTFREGKEANIFHLQRLQDALRDGELDFSHNEELWWYYITGKATGFSERHLAELERYTTPEVIRRPYGTNEGDMLKFGPNTRDVARYIGDLIRWKLKLPVRRGLAGLRARLIDEGKLLSSQEVLVPDAPIIAP